MADRIDKVLTGYDIPSELFNEAMKRANDANDPKKFVPLKNRKEIYQKEQAINRDEIVKKRRGK